MTPPPMMRMCLPEDMKDGLSEQNDEIRMTNVEKSAPHGYQTRPLICPSGIGLRYSGFFRHFHRIPQQKGSCSSSKSVASAVTNAVPMMVGSMVPAVRSSQR